MGRFEWTPRWSGEKVDETRCRAAVNEGGRGVGFYQCQHKAKPRTKWCGIHSDEAEAKRRAKTQAAIDADRAKWEAEAARDARRIACVNACAGIPDPAAALERAREALNIAPWKFETEHAELLSCVVCGGTEIVGHVNACIVAEALRALTPEGE